MKKICCLFFYLFLSSIMYAQFMVDTIDIVEIKGSKILKKTNFSTFTNSISLNNSKFGMVNQYTNSSSKEYILPVAILIENPKRLSIRLDSMHIKSSIVDTSKLMFSLNVFVSNKLFSSSRVKFVSRKGDTYTIFFNEDVHLPKDTAYIGFSYITKDSYNFNLYTNKRIVGHLYSYNKERDEFRLLKFDTDNIKLTCPQVQIYYTKLKD